MWTPPTPAPAPGDPAVVSNCPFCASPRVATTNKTLSTSTYWRCAACGEIWNPGRAIAGAAARTRRW